MFVLGTNLATGVVIARVIGPASLGVWALFQLILGYAEGLGRPKLDQAAVYFVAKRTYDPGRVAFMLDAVALGCGALLALAGMMAFDPLYELLFRDAPDVRALIPIVLLQIPLQFVYLNYSYLHIGLEDVRTYNRMRVVRTVVTSLTTVMLLGLFAWGLPGVVWAALLGVAAGLAYGGARFHRTFSLRPHWDWPLLRALTSYASRLYVAGAVAQLNAQATNGICALFLPPAQLAYFSLASARRDLVNLVPNAVNTLLFPRLSRIPGRSDAARFAARASRVLVLFLLPIGGVAVLVVRPAVLFLYGAEFLPVVPPFLVLLPGLVIYAAVTPYLQYFLGIGRPDLTVKVAIPAVVAQLALATWLVPMYGVMGAAIAVLASLLLGSTLTAIVFLRLSRLRAREILAIRVEDARFVARFAAHVLDRAASPASVEASVGGERHSTGQR